MTSIPTPLHCIASDGQLRLVKAPMESRIKGPRRELWAPPDIANLLENELSLDQRPRPQLAASLQRFIGRNVLSVSMKGDSKKLPDFERYSSDNRVWGMCFRDVAESQWRLLGRFTKRDIFVGVALYQRSSLVPRKSYNVAISNVAQLWEILFPNMECVSGNELKDYFDGPIRDLDEPLF